jgi:hypothetical protein
MSDGGDPVSWLLIEPGWKVVTSDGTEIGTVREVVGDTGKDIFDGLAVSSGLRGKPRYVPAERVRSITEGRIELSLDENAAKHLDEYEEPPPSEEILPVGSSFWQRLRDFFRG